MQHGPSTADPSVPARRRDLAIALVGLAALLLWDASGLDLRVMRLFGGANGFPLQHAFVPSTLLHTGGRWISYALFAGVLVNALWPLPGPIALPARQRVFWLVVTVVCLALIPLLKHFSLTSCPWDLAEFGGRAQYVSHWRLGVADGGPGRCFPAGHASGAFGFLAGYFALRTRYRRAARVWLGGVVVLGLVFGAAQTVRGAHFPSHTLYTAWLCWTISALAYRWVSTPVGDPFRSGRPRRN